MKIDLLDPSRWSNPYDHNLGNALADLGHDVSLVTGPYLYDREIPNRRYTTRSIYYNLAHGGRTARPGHVNRWLKGFEHVVGDLRLPLSVAARRSEVLHVQWAPVPALDRVAFDLVRGFHVPLVITAHNLLPHGQEEDANALKRFAALYAKADAVIAHTEATEQGLVERMGVAPERVARIPHGHFLHLDDYPLQDVPQLEPLEACRVVCFFGLVEEYKGLDRALRAFAKATKAMDDARFLIVGRFNQPVELYVDLIQELDIADRVTVIRGYLPEAHIASHLQYADLAVLPYRHVDQSGAAAALASLGRPLLATDVGGLSDYVRDGVNGRLVDNDDDALAEAMREMLEQPDTLRTMGKASTRIMEQEFGWETIARQHVAVYEAVRSGASPSDAAAQAAMGSK